MIKTPIRYPKLLRKAMLQNERDVIARIRTGHPIVWCSIAWHNAIDRLEAKGRLHYSRREHRFVVVKRKRAPNAKRVRR